MDKQTSPLGEISPLSSEISLTEMKISPYKHSQAGWPGYRDESSKMPPQAIFNNCQNNEIFPASVMKFSHINTRQIHPAYRAVLLGELVRLPYKQPLTLFT